MVREQYFMLLIDQQAALEAIPNMLPADEGARRSGLAALSQVLSASGEIAGNAAERLREIAQLFGVEGNLTIAASRFVEKATAVEGFLAKLRSACRSQSYRRIETIETER